MTSSVDHEFIAYPDAHPSHGLHCLRCGQHKRFHPTIEEPATVPDMDYTDSIANAYGALRSAMSQAADACVELPAETPDWRDTEVGTDVLALWRALYTLWEGNFPSVTLGPCISKGTLEMEIHKARIGRWGGE